MNFKQIKKHYSTSIESVSYFNINHKLIDIVLEFRPKNVFEFGANWGRNLQLLREHDNSILAKGIDISKFAIAEAQKRGLDVQYYDERILKDFSDNLFDVVFTCSVLNHIPDPEFTPIIKDLMRIGKNVVFCESNDASNLPQNNNGRWFRHIYDAFGLRNAAHLKNPITGGHNDFWIFTKGGNG